MDIIIQKFGGTSVSSKERRSMAINKIKKAIDDGFAPVVVVSAMGRKGEPYATDTLLSLLDEDFKNENKLASDLIVCCGEIISSVVMCNELKNRGIEAVPLTGGQAGILTDSSYTSASLIHTNPKNIKEILNEGKVPVVTGFQGVDSNGFLTTLGRGGSDTSASILGVSLNAKEIQIYTDVDGMMTADPRIVEKAEVIDKISYNEVFQLADQGAKVIHPKAVEMAMKGNIPLVIKNTMSDAVGTVIDVMGNTESKNYIVGITYQDNRLQVTINKSSNGNNEGYKHILDTLANNNISLDLINIFPNEKIFTVDAVDRELLISTLKNEGLNFEIREKLSKIAVVGSKMKGIPGVMAKILNALDKENIEVLQTADSHMTIWCLIEDDKVAKAINSIHKVFLE
ncbi:aspartate kinase [Clostridium cavendishii DSM 21758]|uniref:Aspartokinase n=1 Tax=Clostridium cavendishii DSM 21758 TaxID=1121302 RepID=A0A1M6RNT0_9CLOT|nr:aspartate kinase [Clostridium cavendishii]SHK34050.1 aspartate kinase [Clostridium cavendishii DSM 21758]